MGTSLGVRVSRIAAAPGRRRRSRALGGPRFSRGVLPAPLV